MAITQINVESPSNQIVFTDTAMGNSVDGVKSSSALLLFAIVDNSGNSGAASYVKLFNLASGSVTPGTTAPDEILYVPGGAIVTREYFTGAVVGVTFGTALSAFCVTAGGTAGVTAPSNPVTVTLAYV